MRGDKPNHLSRTPMERFMEKISPEPNSGCWLWTGHLNRLGYGLLYLHGKQVPAHRAALILFTRLPQPGENALHRCDNPPCVNPDHLYFGSQSENALDAYKRGRRPLGENHATAKLCDIDIAYIRLSKETNRALGIKYGVGYGTIGQVRRRETWQHLP